MRNPYGQDLGTRDAREALRQTPERIKALVERISEPDFGRSYSAGKWTLAQLLDHLVQAELMFGVRIRMALTTPGYVVQPFDQDRMMAREGRHTGREAFETYYALRRWNLALYRGLSTEDRERRLVHPEHGEITVDNLLEILAGHELHHVAHFESIAADAQR